jgi:hypothetical protein
MNNPDSQIENQLRRAPAPTPPAGLKQRLIAQSHAKAAGTNSEPSRVVVTRAPSGFFSRWWPILASGAVTLTCAIVLAVQGIEVSDLKATLASLPQAPPEPASDQTALESAKSVVPARETPEQELARLKSSVNRLGEEIAQLERLTVENDKLQGDLARAARAGGLTADEEAAMAKAKGKASRIVCINNMKQLGLAARIWANDHGELNPSDILSMTNEMNTPKILYCPADTSRQAATSWANYSAVNCSYEYLAPLSPTGEPTRVLFRCPIHGTIGLVDGSVQSEVAVNHPDWLVTRDGKLYMEPPNAKQP